MQSRRPGRPLTPHRVWAEHHRTRNHGQRSDWIQAVEGVAGSLWVAQVLLAANFGFAGVLKSTAPIEQLAKMLVWPGALPEPLVRFIGVSELAAAIGLVLPALTRIRPALTPVAAAGFVLIMALATAFHVMRGELQALPVVLPLGALAAFVLWGRWKKAPIAPR